MLLHTTTIVTWLSLFLRLLIAIVSMNFLGKTWQKIRGKSKENLKEPPPVHLNLCDRCRAIINDAADVVGLSGPQQRSSSDTNSDGYTGDKEYYKSNEFNNSDESSTLDCDDDDRDDADIDGLNTTTTATIKRKHTQNDYTYKAVKPVVAAAVSSTETDHYHQQQSQEKNQQREKALFRKNTVSMLTKKFEANEHNTQRTYSPISSVAAASATMIETISSKYFSKKTDKYYLQIINGENHETNNNVINNKSEVADVCWLEGPTSDNDDSLTDTKLMDTKKLPRNSADRLRIARQFSEKTEDTSDDCYISDIDNNNYCSADSDIDNDTVEYRKKSTNENSGFVNSVDEILEQNRFSKRLSDYSLSDFMMDFSEHDDMEVTNIFNRI